MNRVVITGIGAVTPLGNDFPSSWASTRDGVSGIGPISRFDPQGMPYSAAGEIKGFDPAAFLSRKELHHTDPFAVYAFAAAQEAVRDAVLHPGNSLHQSGVIIGTSRGGITTLEKAFVGYNNTSASNRLSPFVMPSTTMNMASSVIARHLGFCGTSLGISNACASGANAIGEAFRMIRRGDARMLLAGGTEAPLCRFCFEGYGAARALSRSSGPTACRPFDLARDGFVLAEGACIMVLEELGAALRRGASVYAEIIGYGATNDGHHMTLPHRDGETGALRKALADAGITSERVDYINAHATSTLAGDRTESEAIAAVLGERRVPVSSVKSMTGHMLAASGAYEAACTAMSLHEGFIPPTINTRDIDPACQVTVVTSPQERSLEVALSNSFGFGGVNAVLALRRFVS